MPVLSTGELKDHPQPKCHLRIAQVFLFAKVTVTSKLESYLSKELYTRFGEYSIRQNYRPDWMDGLELDFYIDELKLAAEVQGAQHYSFVEFFHRSQKAFEDQKQRDINKKYLCRLNKVELVEIYTEQDADLFLILVEDKTRQRIGYSYNYDYGKLKIKPPKMKKKDWKKKQEKSRRDIKRAIRQSANWD